MVLLRAARTRLDRARRTRVCAGSGSRWAGSFHRRRPRLANAAAAHAWHDESPGAPGAGLVVVGGFAFAPEGGHAPSWAGFAPASMVIPEISLARRGRRTWITVAAQLLPDDRADDVMERVIRRLQRLQGGRCRCWIRPPSAHTRCSVRCRRRITKRPLQRATERIAASEFEKVVLARERLMSTRPPTTIPRRGLRTPARGVRRAHSCTRSAVARRPSSAPPPSCWSAGRASARQTVALAGSTRRSADPAVDDHLGEQLLRSDKDREENAIVARRIARTLAPLSVWVAAAPEPMVVKVANIQHLAAPDPRAAGGANRCGDPGRAAAPDAGRRRRAAPARSALIPALEGFDRGWYAGAVGWTDAAGDGEFCVALRCALLRGRHGRCYAGCGIVRDSDPASELAETEIKLGVMLPALAG